MMDHTASSTMDPFCTRLTNRITGQSDPEYGDSSLFKTLPQETGTEPYEQEESAE